jgi:hypothetical protein
MEPGPRYGSVSLNVSTTVQSKKIAFIITVAVVLAIAGCPNDGNLTSVLNTQCYRSPTEDLVCFVGISGETEQYKLQNTP